MRHPGRVLLKLALARHVDDLFAVGHEENVAYALACFVRLVRALLGDDAMGDEKCEHGMPLAVLGLRFEASLQGVRRRVVESKGVKWLKGVA